MMLIINLIIKKGRQEHDRRRPGSYYNIIHYNIIHYNIIYNIRIRIIYQSSSSHSDTNIYAITLLNTDESKKRLKQINYKHKVVEAYHHTSDEPHANIVTKGRARQRATFYSHMKVWQKIASEQRSAVVCEDDAVLLEGRSFNTSSLQQDGITLLGGCIRTPGAWVREKSEFVENLKFLEIVKNFKSGTNIITNEFRWTNCLAYYIPWNLAEELIQTVSDCLGKVRPVDIWLGKQPQMKHLYYPNVFIDMDNATTQVKSPKGHQKADFYICEFAMKKNIRLTTLTTRGSNTPEEVFIIKNDITHDIMYDNVDYNK